MSKAVPVGLGKAWGIWSAVSFVLLVLFILSGGARAGGAVPVLGLWFWGLVALAFPQVRRLLSWSAKTVPAATRAAGDALEKARIKAAVPDEPLYDLVASELAKRDIKPGLWAKAFAESQGDKEKAKAAYIQLRVEQLRNDCATSAQEVGNAAR
jgi:hypothetical protein